MFIHGKLFLTENHIMLDEMRSLLQKSLRRKEWVLALQSAKELLGYEKDQLPWKSLVTFLFEDHCLSDTDVLMTLYKAFEQNTREAKYRCVELLMQCKTCRVAACLPVIALDSPYEPKRWDANITVRESVCGLMVQGKGLFNTDQLLEHLLVAWNDKNHERIITYMKLATMVVENEKRQLTNKGQEYLISKQRRKPHFGLIVLSALYRNTDDPSMRQYLAACHRLATVPEVCVRLILFAPLARMMFSDKVSEVPNKKMGRVDWKTIRKLKYMPPWAVDKHTFRGKFGRDTKCILKKKPTGMTDEEYDEFHGPREKRDLYSFFIEGVKCTKESLEENPFWERTKELYFLQPPKQQKTTYMTQVYHKTLQRKYPALFALSTSPQFDYSAKPNGGLFGPPIRTGESSRGNKLKPPAEDQKRLHDFFKPSTSSPSVQVTEENSNLSPPKEQSESRKRRVSEVSDSEPIPQEGLSRAKRRRMKEVEKRKSEYESERLAPKRKVAGIVSGEFATVAKKLGCPDTLPDNLFDDDDDFMTGTKYAALTSSLKRSSPSDDSGSDFVRVPSPFSSPEASYLKQFELPGTNSIAGPSSLTHRRSFDESDYAEANGLTDDVLAGLEGEFEEDMKDEDGQEEWGEEEQEEVEEEVAESSEEQQEEEMEEEGMLSFRGPLLQLPTSAQKVYTVADLDEEKVVKGPYRNKVKLHRVMFLHQVMRDVIGDPHTLDFEPDLPYLLFPLLKGHEASLEITTRNFTDCISQADIEDAEFLTRDCLGIVQVHKVSPQAIKKLPVTLWSHFLFRFALNVGDSGLYNAITDSKLTFVYGIDMEENRGEVAPNGSILDVMFSKAPRRDLREAIMVTIKQKKMDLFREVSKQINYAQMDRLAREYDVEYDRLLFIERIKLVRQLVAKL